MEWTRIVCLPSRIPVFLKIKNKKKSRSGRKIGAVGDDKQLIVFTRPYLFFFFFFFVRYGELLFVGCHLLMFSFLDSPFMFALKKSAFV